MRLVSSLLARGRRQVFNLKVDRQKGGGFVVQPIRFLDSK